MTESPLHSQSRLDWPRPLDHGQLPARLNAPELIGPVPDRRNPLTTNCPSPAAIGRGFDKWRLIAFDLQRITTFPSASYFLYHTEHQQSPQEFLLPWLLLSA